MVTEFACQQHVKNHMFWTIRDYVCVQRGTINDRHTSPKTVLHATALRNMNITLSTLHFWWGFSLGKSKWNQQKQQQERPALICWCQFIVFTCQHKHSLQTKRPFHLLCKLRKTMNFGTTSTSILSFLCHGIEYWPGNNKHSCVCVKICLQPLLAIAILGFLFFRYAGEMDMKKAFAFSGPLPNTYCPRIILSINLIWQFMRFFPFLCKTTYRLCRTHVRNGQMAFMHWCKMSENDKKNENDLSTYKKKIQL